MGADSKAKGAAGEYEIVDFFTKIFGKPFHRTQKSGAVLGGANARLRDRRDDGQQLQLLGDIQPPTGWAFVIESKNYADFPFHSMLLGKETILWDWIKQCRDDAKRGAVKETYFPHTLIFKVTRRGTWMCLPHQHFSKEIMHENLKHHFSYSHISNAYGFEDCYTVFNIKELETNSILKDHVQSVISTFELK